MNGIAEQLVAEFVAGCRRAAAHGLMRCSSGNISRRVDATTMLIKASRSWLAELTTADIAVCRIEDGTPLTDKKPSAEIGFHAGVLRNRTDMNIVMHFQTPAATTLACTAMHDEAYQVIPEIPYYIGNIKTVPYLRPGSESLATAVTAALNDHNLVQLRNHGQVTVGRTFEEAIQNAVFFELACEVILRGGERIQPLDKMAIRNLRIERMEEQSGAV